MFSSSALFSGLWYWSWWVYMSVRVLTYVSKFCSFIGSCGSEQTREERAVSRGGHTGKSLGEGTGRGGTLSGPFLKIYQQNQNKPKSMQNSGGDGSPMEDGHIPRMETNSGSSWTEPRDGTGGTSAEPRESSGGAGETGFIFMGQKHCGSDWFGS